MAHEPPGARKHALLVEPVNEPKRRRVDGNVPDASDLFSFFRKLRLEKAEITGLFGDSAVVLALFRSLDDVEKVIVVRLLTLSEPTRWEPFVIWLNLSRRSTLRALSSLRALNILCIHAGGAQRAPRHQGGSQPPSPGSSAVGQGDASSAAGSATESSLSLASATAKSVSDLRYELHATFRSTLQKALVDGISSSTVIGTSPKRAKQFPTKAAVQAHAAQQWKNVLRWLCENSDGMAPKFELPLHAPNNVLSPAAAPSRDLHAVLSRLRLVRTTTTTTSSVERQDESRNETFQWLLRDIRAQLVSICVAFLHCLHSGGSVQDWELEPSGSPPSSQAASAQRTEALQLLLALSEALIGQPCYLGGLTVTQKRFIALAYEVGLVWMYVKPKGGCGKHFFPTPFVKLLQVDSPEMAHTTSSISTLVALGADSCGHPLAASLELPGHFYDSAYSRFFAHEQSADYPPISDCPRSDTQTAATAATTAPPCAESGVIVESNFKVFAYTCDTLLISVVARLCELRVITPSLVVGTLSRGSVLESFKAGATAAQIIRFFHAHAHPSIYAKSALTGTPILPENVTTQLQMWEAERRRLKMTRACLFEFSKESDILVFPSAVARAASGWLLLSTATPTSSNPTSEPFQKWREETLQRLRTRATATAASDGTQVAIAPVLAVHARYKDEMTSFIRASLRARGQ